MLTNMEKVESFYSPPPLGDFVPPMALLWGGGAVIVLPSARIETSPDFYMGNKEGDNMACNF